MQVKSSPPANSPRFLQQLRHRIIDYLPATQGPALICVAGLHGNEPMGVRALERVATNLRKEGTPVRGTFIALVGNVKALKAGKRFLDCDLNRLWSRERLQQLRSGQRPQSSEESELAELVSIIDQTVGQMPSEFYLLDLHTTSADGGPFCVFGDTIRNRDFASNFGVPMILGLEEQIGGLLVESAGSMGAVSIGFEAGRHQCRDSIDLHSAAIRIALVTSGLVPAGPAYESSLQLLRAKAKGLPRVVEVVHRHEVSPGDKFRMIAGFRNFQTVPKGVPLASDSRGSVVAPRRGRVVLPLYQELGDDGFFLVRDVAPVWLKLSRILRKLGLHHFVRFLPGVTPHPLDEHSLVVNPAVARWMILQVFHLLGFRKRRSNGPELIFSRREFDLDSPFSS